MKTILCKFHNDTRPSMRVYSEWSHCYVCGAHVLTTSLDLGDVLITSKSEPTNIPKMMEYIRSLPLVTIRGLQFHANDRGFYITWPGIDYYKLRLWKGKTRYIAPSGVKPPLFVYPGSSRNLIIVEGELNAMSLHNSLYGEYKVCSPGPASDLLRHIKYYIQYKHINIVVDNDAPGIIFGCQLRDHLLKLGKHVKLINVATDYNQVLQDSGEEAVRQAFEGAI